MPSSMISRLAPLPLVGRDTEVQMIRSLLDGAGDGRGGTLILHGSSGVGTSRLLGFAREEATRRGWSSVTGRAYSVGSGIPYAPFTDAFLPLLLALPPESLEALTQGGENDLASLFPMLPPPAAVPGEVLKKPEELRTRLFYSFTRFLRRLTVRDPLLVLLDDLHWADASSLELLHFVARQIGSDRVALLCAYNDTLRGQNPQLYTLEQSLRSGEAVCSRSVDPLTREDTAALVEAVFGSQEAASDEFTTSLFGRTRGNPFFVEEVLKAAVTSGRLRRQEGSWVGWELDEVALPNSIREAVLRRLGALSAPARSIADTMAVIGTDIAHSSLRSVCEVGEDELVAGIDELRHLGIVEERRELNAVVYDFTHPVLREGLYRELGLARAELLHTRAAEALETCYGAESMQHAGELAYHFARSRAPHLGDRTIRYLWAAGRAALQKYSNREAADFLRAALEHASGAAPADVPVDFLEDLARARHRLGDLDGTVEVLHRARAAALAKRDHVAVAGLERRLGLVYCRNGRHAEALEHYASGLKWAIEEQADDLYARLRLAEGDCLMEMGRSADARRCVEDALEVAERLGEDAQIARGHLALLLLHTWAGPPEAARAHGERALALAESMGDPSLCCTVHWALTMLSGLTGDADATARHIGACSRLAEELHSPLHRLRAAELAVEYSARTGDWARGIDTGEHAIVSARALRQHAALARLLVWTALIYVGRGELERAKRYLDEAWVLSGADDAEGKVDVHTVVAAHCGMAAHHVAAGEFAAALRIGERGLAIADRTGYTVWALHRLLPTIVEAHLSSGDLEGAARAGARLREESRRLGHRLGLAWADACDGFLVWLRGDIVAGIEQLRAAAERLESISVIPDAARLRRHLAARLRDHHEPEEALRELRSLHGVFLELGAAGELASTREQMRQLGARPPSRDVSPGMFGLSPRELEIGRLVAARKSNKAIAKELDISPRTVSTHLTNMFRKLQVDSRSAVADTLRESDLLTPSGTL